MTAAEVSIHFTGIALECIPTAEFTKKRAPRPVAVGDISGRIFGLRVAVIQAVILAMALEVFVLAGPMFNQFVVDEVIVGGDHELLKLLTLGFALMLVIQIIFSVGRSWFMARWSVDIDLQWGVRVFSHLTKLPLEFFERRHLGDIVSKFGSLNSIQATLTSLFVESLLDGLMAICALLMMLIYSSKLTIIVVLAISIYALLRWFAYAPLQEASLERLVLSAKENSYFLETLRAILPLKLYGRELERTARWQNIKLDVLNRDIRTQKIAIGFKAANAAITGFQGLAVFYVGAGLVMQNFLSVGMLLAFSTYAVNFSGRVRALIDIFVEVKMLNLHTERVADIVLETSEKDCTRVVCTEQLQPEITLCNIRFRYAEGEPWILDRVNLHIHAGDNIALIGPSGGGKTTLCKVILGLLSPTEGEILIGGVPLSQVGISAYRRMIGTVMQDDMLLAGSIAENICFFDEKPECEYMQKCAQQAAIHDEIALMPMGYQTLVGDMGSSLSGGQKQRILLARALYKRPAILTLDEATSHLDISNENAVNANLAELKLTRFVVAHRPETIAAAGRVVRLEAGELTEVKVSEQGINFMSLRRHAGE